MSPNTSSMSTYQLLGFRPKTCFVCNKIMDKTDKWGEISFMVCENKKHFCHKKCLKQKYKYNHDEKLDAGYIYSSGINKYKNHKCRCNSSMKIHNTLKYKVKKFLKYSSPILLILLI